MFHFFKIIFIALLCLVLIRSLFGERAMKVVVTFFAAIFVIVFVVALAYGALH